MLVINLFGAPSSGKSTTASGLYFLMKHAGFNVELINEYAKQLVWSERQKTLSDQLYVTAKQNHKLEILRNKVDYVISDSPLPLGLVYAPKNYHNSYSNLLMEIFHSYENINFFLKRTKHYNPLGRLQNEQESDLISIKIENLFKFLKIPYINCVGDKNAPQNILDILIDLKKKIN